MYYNIIVVVSYSRTRVCNVCMCVCVCVACALVQREFDWDRLDGGGDVGVRGKRLAIAIAGAREADQYSVVDCRGTVNRDKLRRAKRKWNIE